MQEFEECSLVVIFKFCATDCRSTSQPLWASISWGSSNGA